MQKYVMVSGWLGYTDGIYRSDANGIVRPDAVPVAEQCVHDANIASERIAELHFSLAAAELREAQANELLRAATEGLNVCSGALLKANKETTRARDLAAGNEAAWRKAAAERHDAIEAIRLALPCLQNWAYIADDEDDREEDWDALRAMRAVLAKVQP